MRLAGVAALRSDKLPERWAPAMILHVDMDAFYASIEQRGRLDAATDEITARYGRSAIGRAGRIRKKDESDPP